MSEAARGFADGAAPLAPGVAARLRAMLLAQWDRLALWLPVAMGIGILVYFSLPTEPAPIWAWLALLPVPVAFLLRLWRRVAGWAMGLVAMAGIGFAVALGQTAWQVPQPMLPSKAVTLSGVVREVELLPEGRRLTLGEVRAVAAPARGDMPSAPAFVPGGGAVPENPVFSTGRGIRLRLRANDPARPEPGDQVSLRALMRPPPPPGYPGGWDYQRASYFSGLAGSAQALGPASVVSGQGEASAFARLRARIEARINADLPGGAGAVSAALLTGGTSAIPQADLVAMRDSGLAHLLSVSGLHIAVVMGLVFAVTRFLVALVPAIALRWDSRAAAVLLGLVAGGAYMVLTGSQVPMVRSFAMAALVALGVMLGRRAISLRALGLAAMVVMLVQPVAVLGPSFQMSFAAVLALIAGWEVARPHLQAWRGEGQWWRVVLIAVLGLAMTSVLAGAATMPFGLHHFGRLQLYGVAANAVAIPLTSFIVMPAGMLALALMPLGLEHWALVPMGLGVEGVLWTARLVASWPGAAMGASPLPAWGLAVATGGLLWLCLWRGGLRLWGLPAMALGLAAGFWAAPPDLLVSSDARLIALRTPVGVVVQRVSGGSNFTRESWLRGWGEEGAEAMPVQGQAAGGLVDCAPGLCRLRARAGGPLVLLLRGEGKRDAPKPEVPLEACEGVVLVVSAEPVRGACPGAPVIDRFTAWRQGAQAVRLGMGGAAVLTDQAARGERPWVIAAPGAER